MVPQALPAMSILSIQPGKETANRYLSLVTTGDSDTLVVDDSRKTGNGAILTSLDGNTAADSYLQFNVEDSAMLEG
jgi:hypothetical protein